MRSAVIPIALALWGCGGDEPTPVDLGPTGQPTIRFASPPADACISIGDDVSGRVPLLIDTEELVLNPPDACGVFVQCGHLVLYAEGVENNRSAVRGIDLLLHRLADPVHDGSVHAGTGEADLLDLRVEVVTDAGTVMLDHLGEPVAAEVAVVSVPDCGALADPSR